MLQNNGQVCVWKAEPKNRKLCKVLLLQLPGFLFFCFNPLASNQRKPILVIKWESTQSVMVHRNADGTLTTCGLFTTSQNCLSFFSEILMTQCSKKITNHTNVWPPNMCRYNSATKSTITNQNNGICETLTIHTSFCGQQNKMPLPVAELCTESLCCTAQSAQQNQLSKSSRVSALLRVCLALLNFQAGEQQMRLSTSSSIGLVTSALAAYLTHM